MSVRQLLDLTGRVALVTGGSRGLGLQIAEALGEMGARVALTARKPDELEEARAGLAKIGVEALPIACDLSDAAAIPGMVEKAVTGLGPIDILVNNAGTTWGADTADFPMEQWQRVLQLNLTAMFATTQEVGRRCMIPRRRGRIVNIASILGLIATNDTSRPGTIAYSASKGGVISFTRALAAEWARHDINVNAIAPGFFPTKMTRGLLKLIGDRAASKAPLNRVGGPEDLKGVALLLASDAGAFITGQVIAVDGGATAI
ncbi:MAG TPA: SDR family oxidoreductase [Usitatibacter sp.]|nr:SDR family oxidoreductase [Usitatibacter sp.]